MDGVDSWKDTSAGCLARSLAHSRHWDPKKPDENGGFLLVDVLDLGAKPQHFVREVCELVYVKLMYLDRYLETQKSVTLNCYNSGKKLEQPWRWRIYSWI